MARDIRLETARSSATLSCAVVADGADLPDRLWFRIPCDDAPLIDQSGSAFFPLLTIVAMRLGRDLHIEAPVSAELLKSVPRLMATYLEWSEGFETLWPVRITAASHATPRRGVHAASFFSCGLDSTFTFLRNINRYPPDDSRALSHMIIVHGFDVPLANASYFEQILERARRVADAYGKRLVSIATNAREGGFRCVDFQHYAHGPSLASVGLALGRGFHTIFIPATDFATDLLPWGSHPAVDPVWSTENVEFVHDGLEWRRVEKAVYVAQVPLFLDTLRVCGVEQTASYNCGRCSKCLRFMTELELVGALERSSVFPKLDLDAVAKFPYADRRSCDLWTHTRNYARDLGRTEIVKAIETAMARFERSEYRVLAPLAAMLGALGVTADHLRTVKRGLIRRLSGIPSLRDRPGES